MTGAPAHDVVIAITILAAAASVIGMVVCLLLVQRSALNNTHLDDDTARYLNDLTGEAERSAREVAAGAETPPAS